MTSVRILLADDHEVVRRGLRALLESPGGWEVCGEASNGREAVDKAKKLKPEIVVLDIGMPGLNGLEATRQILKALPRTQVLILTVQESEQVIREVVEAGARGYVLKSDAGRDLVAAVDALGHHRTFFTSKVSEVVLKGYRKGGTAREPEGKSRSLPTPREREILQLLAESKSNKEVAATLGISVKTAETHRSNIMRKLSFHSMSELVRYAIRNKLVEP